MQERYGYERGWGSVRLSGPQECVNGDAEGDAYIVEWIYVLPEYRGRGIGSKMLRQVVEDADRERAVLYLDVSGSGPLDNDDLRAWYGRYGFEERDGAMVRRPARQRRAV